jgi:hypothetical protein
MCGNRRLLLFDSDDDEVGIGLGAHEVLHEKLNSLVFAGASVNLNNSRLCRRLGRILIRLLLLRSSLLMSKDLITH